jgi:D-alanyl-D-alanine carboxypeptidase/D-alanyl-D-alanine-endopeptidase (penicillin-binding protein 4)
VAGLLLHLVCAVCHAELPAEIEKVLARHKIPADAVSLMVQAVDEDTPRLALNVDVPRNPASTEKLVTTWVALDLLGPTHVWPTSVYALGPVKDGVLEGDLLIKGTGDPYFVLEDLWAMLGQLRRSGIHHITGDLLIDDSLFADEGEDPAAFDGQGDRLYNVLPNAWLVNFKSIDFAFDVDRRSGRLAISTIPALANLEVVNHVKLTDEPCRGNALQIVMRRPDPADMSRVEFAGRMPASCRHFQLPRSIMTPGAYAYGAFRTVWAQWGGTIDGSYRRAVAPPGATPRLTWESRHLAEVIRPLNKWSNNVMARMLLLAIGGTRFPPPLTRAHGQTALIEHLASRGFDTTGLVIENGSGLSRHSRITARFMVDLLRRAWAEPTMPEFMASLSIVGKDGTTRRRLRDGPEAARMHLKTGSLANVSAVSGYVHAAGGKTFAVCVFTNYRNANYGIGTAVQDALLRWAFHQ